MASGPLTLAQLARAVGMSTREVKLYQDCGLVPPARRRPGRSDEYGFGVVHVDCLRFIQRSLGYGFSLDNIARLAGETALTTCNDVYRLSVNRLEELRREAGSDEATVRALEELIATCARVGARSDCRILAALDNDRARQRRVRAWKPCPSRLRRRPPHQDRVL